MSSCFDLPLAPSPAKAHRATGGEAWKVHDPQRPVHQFHTDLLQFIQADPFGLLEGKQRGDVFEEE